MYRIVNVGARELKVVRGASRDTSSSNRALHRAGSSERGVSQRWRTTRPARTCPPAAVLEQQGQGGCELSGLLSVHGAVGMTGSERAWTDRHDMLSFRAAVWVVVHQPPLKEISL